MALVASDIRFFLSGAGSAGGAQSNPALSLGNFRSSTEIRALASTFTAIAAAGALSVVDSTQIGASHAGKWLMIMGGANAVTYVSRVAGFNASTGAYHLEHRLPSGVSSGDAYQLFVDEALFDNVSAAECAAGDEEYRCLVVRNVTGFTLTSMKAYIEVVEPGGCRFSLVSDDTTAGDPSVPVSASESVEPDLTGFPQTAGTDDAFESPRTYAMSDQPKGTGTGASLATNGSRHIWLRRVVPPLSRDVSRAVAKLVVEATNTGGTPSPIRSACLIPYRLLGITPALSLRQDRVPYIGGGLRLRATLTAQENGAPLEGEEVLFDITSGPGSLAESLLETDEDGVADVPYLSPTNQGDAGDTVTFRARTAG